MAVGYQKREKQSYDQMWVDEYINTRGESSYCLRYTGKNPNTRKNKQYVKTYKVPKNIKKQNEKEAFCSKIQSEFKKEVEDISRGVLISKVDNILFKDYATEWVEEILSYRKLSHNYYLACKDRLKVMIEKLGNYYLHEISPLVVKNFSKWLNERTYKKEVAIVKESLKPLIKQRKITLVKVVLGTGLCDTTLREAFKIGSKISADTATKIANFLDVPVKRYFNIESVNMPYSQNSNISTKNTFQAILKEAFSLELIGRNPVPKDSKNKIKGTRGDREIYKDDEVKQFIKAIENESDIRKQVAFSLYIYIGLRNSELVGLEWQDVNFNSGKIHIERNCLYLGSRFKTITKDTKTKNSNRTVLMPPCLVDLLRRYKAYWDEQKINHGNLWERTDRLFCQDNGYDMVGSTPAGWLKDFEQRNGLKYVSPHGLRHTNITMLIKNKIDVRTVSGRAGHSNISTTLNIYSHFTQEGDELAANKLQEIFANC